MGPDIVPWTVVFNRAIQYSEHETKTFHTPYSSIIESVYLLGSESRPSHCPVEPKEHRERREEKRNKAAPSNRGTPTSIPKSVTLDREKRRRKWKRDGKERQARVSETLVGDSTERLTSDNGKIQVRGRLGPATVTVNSNGVPATRPVNGDRCPIYDIPSVRKTKTALFPIPTKEKVTT
ncbi:hypothetical protein H6P81_005398 [Aristolochia fimbriata]|uniref:Uncharacterized protein n=1 Tax=Aristolochia fimbriata TaxID=158543 RepID=A0AAV7EVH4_ARIFI|nr:hypothetical protein H6P81_005398 [Aristolochia fimbriata]